MLKYLRLLSDLHLEGTAYKFVPADTDAESVLVLAGDISVGTRAVDFIDEIHDRFIHVIYVLGNHEFYRNSIDTTRQNIDRELVRLGIKNVSVVDKAQLIQIENQQFACGTLWTDMGKNSPLCHLAVRNGLYDFLLIQDQSEDNGIFTTYGAFNIHRDTMEKFADWVDKDSIVITHHMPSEWCVHPRFKESGPINAGFSSDLDYFILENKPKYWLHGHGHDSVNVQVGDTKIMSNPRGYPRRSSNEIPVFENPLFRDVFIIDL